MQGHGRIDVETAHVELTEQRDLTHGVVKSGCYVVIAVTDTGPGIDDAIFENLFDPFFTTRATGNGLGLATVREIVHEHAGAINVSSHAGKGSRFEVWLPCGALGRSGMPGRTEEPFGRGQTILLLSNGREQLLHDEEILAALGYEPVGFLHSEDAVAACGSTPGRFDGILVGCSLSEETARRLPAVLHALAPNLPILVAAYPAETFDVDALVAAGVSEVVSRPIIADEVAAVLARCLQATAAGSPRATFAADGETMARMRVSAVLQ